MPKAGRSYYYAVRVGKNPGIYTNWSDCEKQVKGYPNSRYKKFNTREEADNFISAAVSESGSSSKSRKSEQSSIMAAEVKPTMSHTSFIVDTYRNPIGESKATIIESTTNAKTDEAEKEALEDEGIEVYTDGAASGNGTENAYAGIGVYWGANDKRNLSEPLEGNQTNQRAEIQAVIRAIETCGNDESVLNILTDSMYTVNAVNNWRKEWEKRNWKTSSNQVIKNEDLFRRLFHLIDTRPGKVIVKHVPGHKGDPGNEMADRLAVKGALLSANNRKSPDSV